MFRFTIRELVVLGVTAVVTAGVMYGLWQADRARLALQLSQLQVRAISAEGELERLQKEK